MLIIKERLTGWLGQFLLAKGQFKLLQPTHYPTNKQTLTCPRMQRHPHLDRFFTGLRVSGTGMLTVGCQLWLLEASQLAAQCACVIHAALCDWSHSLLGPVTCSKRLRVGGRGELSLECPRQSLGKFTHVSIRDCNILFCI